MQKPDYKFYSTLLDSFQYYLTSDSEEAFQEFINKLNRVPFTSEAAAKGTAFNCLVDEILKNENKPLYETIINQGKATFLFNGFEFKAEIVNQFVEKLQGAIPQYFCKGLFQTSKGLIELYGYIDEIKFDELTDIKTTSRYEFPKFLHGFQHVVYPYCLHQEGMRLSRFKYLITDFNHVYEEEYIYEPGRDLTRLQDVCERLIDFIETHRHLITDKKLFAQDSFYVAHYDKGAKTMIVQ